MCRYAVNIWKKKIDRMSSIEDGLIMTSFNWLLQSLI